jgi:hypothetical protein
LRLPIGTADILVRHCKMAAGRKIGQQHVKRINPEQA